MAQRGIGKHRSDTITSSLRGVFKNAETRAEFLNLIKSDNFSPLA
jgi:GTP cyclohydrolase I